MQPRTGFVIPTTCEGIYLCTYYPLISWPNFRDPLVHRGNWYFANVNTTVSQDWHPRVSRAREQRFWSPYVHPEPAGTCFPEAEADSYFYVFCSFTRGGSQDFVRRGLFWPRSFWAVIKWALLISVHNTRRRIAATCVHFLCHSSCAKVYIKSRSGASYRTPIWFLGSS